jgi:hypothetical protein
VSCWEALGKAAVNIETAVTATFLCRELSEHSAIAECPTNSTRQRTLCRQILCRLSLPSAALWQVQKVLC